jgi:DNA-binding NtrC family response regulator
MTQNENSKKKRIMMIDDDEFILEIFSAYLGDKYEIKCYTKACEALNYLNQDHNFELIVCDYSMPEMNGADFLKHLRKNGFLTPIIFLTGCITLALARECLRLGVLDILDKPLKPETLQDVIDRVLLLEEARTVYYNDKVSGTSNNKNKMLGVMIAGISERSKRIEGGDD